MLFPKFAIMFPLAFVMIFDFSSTLVGQPSCYWQDYNSCKEASPIGEFLLSLGPEYFTVSFIFYLFAVLFLMAKLSEAKRLFLVMSVFLGHASGGASWLPMLYSNLLLPEINEWYLHVGYFISVSIIAGICFGNNNNQKVKSSAESA